MLPSFYRQTITRIRPGIKESRGSSIPDWENYEALTIGGCNVQPTGTTLSQDGRVEGISDGQIAYTPITADIKAGDRIEYDGEVYAIEGEPRRWTSASGTLDHLILNLKRWQG